MKTDSKLRWYDNPNTPIYLMMGACAVGILALTFKLVGLIVR